MTAQLVVLFTLAHGLYPLAYQVEETPHQPTRLFAGTTFGALLSTDDGAHWKWICEEAIGYGKTDFPVWRVTGSGALWAAAPLGLFVSRDDGCTWSAVNEFSATGASDLWETNGALFATTAKYGVSNGVWRSDDDGLTWRPLLSNSSAFYTSVRGGYVGRWWFTPTTTMALERAQDDGGFASLDVTLSFAGKFRVVAADAGTLFAVVDEQTDAHPSHLLKSTSSGASWKEVATSSDTFNTVAWRTPNVWAGTSAAPFFSSDDGESFTRLASPTQQSCAEAFGAHTYLCGSYAFDGFAIERSVDAGAFTALLTWAQVDGVLACGSGSLVTQRCPGFLAALQATFPPPMTMPDAGVDAGTTPTNMEGTCRCASGTNTLFVLAASLLWRRRHRKGRVFLETRRAVPRSADAVRLPDVEPHS